MVWQITTEELLMRYADGERNFAGAELTNSNRSRYMLSKESVNYGGIDLEGAVLRDINLRGAHFYNVCLVGADLTGADLGGIFLNDCILDEAKMRKVNLSAACVYGSRFNRADLHRTQLTYINATCASFCEAIIGGWFESAILIGTNFIDAKFIINGRDYGNSFIWGDGNFIFKVTLPNGTIMPGPKFS
jgi:uncharacterized protein YjbI with pentapeptide repeats